MNEIYQKTPLNVKFNIKNIVTIHYFKYGKQFTFSGEKHNFWELVYVDSGEVSAISEDIPFSLRQGDIIFHKPNEFHNIFTNDNFANAVIISFECSNRDMSFFKNKILKLADIEKEILSRIMKEAKKCFSDKLDDIYLKKMTFNSALPFGAEQIIKNYLELLLISLIRQNNEAVGRTGLSENIEEFHSNKLINDIIKILKENLDSQVSLDYISNTLFFSKTYIKNIFREKMETSIIQYFIHLKIEEAKRLISMNSYTFTQISDMLSFNSIHYFSRIFKQHTQMTPSEYEKTIKVDNIL